METFLRLTKICKISVSNSEIELRILNIAGPLIKVSITDGRRLILHYIGILSFFMAAILKPSKMADGTHNIEC